MRATENEAVFEQLNQSGVELIVALGREGKRRCRLMPRAAHERWRCRRS